MPYLFKYTIIGDPGVGKTCLSLQFTDQKFETAYEATDYIEFGAQTVTVGDTTVRLHVFDTAGRGVIGPEIRQYYSRVACIILVYDITRRVTFDRITTWLEAAREQARADVTLLLVGNKCDLSNVRAVSYEEGHKFAKKHNLLFLEASAKTAQNVEEAFILTAEKVCKKIEDGALHLSQEIVACRCGAGNITPRESEDVAGSSPWRLLPEFMGFIHRLSFLPELVGFIRRLSFLPKSGTNVG